MTKRTFKPPIMRYVNESTQVTLQVAENSWRFNSWQELWRQAFLQIKSVQASVNG